MGLFELANKLSILSVGRRPVWKLQDREELDSVPQSATDGVQLENAVKALLHLVTRESQAARTTYIDVVTGSAETYTATVDGTSVDYVAAAGESVESIAQGWAANIDGTAVNDGSVRAEAVDRSGNDSDDAVRITGNQVEDYLLQASVTGAAEVALGGDPIEYDFRLYLLPSNAQTDGAESWVEVSSTPVEGVDRRGWSERLTVAGYNRLALQVINQGPSGDDVPARPYPYIGPGIQED